MTANTKINIIISTLFFAILLFSCGKEENPNQIPDDLPRFNELKASYRTILASTEYGWKTTYRPSINSGSFNILMKFHSNGTVSILSDMSKYAISTQNAYYDVKGSTYPELVFETFCVWHQLYEVADGDFQFRIISIDENKVELNKVNSSNKDPEIIFTKASSADYGQMSKIQGMDQLLYNFYTGENEYFKIVQFEEFNVRGLIDFDFDRHQVFLHYQDTYGETSSLLLNYSYDENGIIFEDRVNIAGKIVSRFNISQTGDTILNLSGSQLNDGIIYTTDLPDFEFKGAIDNFNQYSFFYIADYSPSLAALNEEIQNAGEFVIAQIYHNYLLSSGQIYNALTFLIFDETGDHDFYGFHINQFLKLGEDRLRFQWSGGRDQNISNELFEILKNYILFFFNQMGFKIIPMNDYFIFISYADPKNYMIVVPVL